MSHILLFFMQLSVVLKVVNCESHGVQQHLSHLYRNKIEMMESFHAAVAQLERINSTLDDLERRLKAMEQHDGAQKLTGASFTRWGRNDCPANTSHLLYSGSVGGSWWDHMGGASTYLCLHENPQRLKRFETRFRYPNLFGGEFYSNKFGNGWTGGHGIACAVCQSEAGSQKLMTPARIECLPGWTKQYVGYLGTGYFDHHSSKEYICVDENPMAARKGHSRKKGALVYPVQATCGSLPCPPYRHGDTVTCVVCTK